MIECPEGHICFSKDNLDVCGMKGCGKSTLTISPIDPNMPKDVKKQIQKVFLR
jgi:hypothetical protein